MTVQHGTNVIVGIGDFTYAGHIVGNSNLKPTGTHRPIIGENGNRETDIFTDLGKELTIETVVKVGSDPESLAMGDVVTVNSIYYVVMDVDPRRAKGEEMTLVLSLEKKDGMDYTP